MKCILIIIFFNSLSIFFHPLSMELTPITNSGKPIVINFEKSIGNEKEIKLSEIVSNIEYVPLETNKNALLASISKVAPTRDYIFLESRGNIYQFQRNGKFLHRVGKSGSGPGEYSIARDYKIDEASEYIYILTNWSKKILVFSFNGKFIKSIPFIDSMSFEKLPGNVFLAAMGNGSGQEKYRLVALKNNKDTLKCFPNYIKFPYRKNQFTFISDNIDLDFYCFNNEVFYREKYNDTIFKITSSISFLPNIILSLGKYKIPIEHRIEFLASGKEFRKYSSRYYNTKVEETNNYVFVTYMSYLENDPKKALLYDKKAHIGFRLKNQNNKEIGMIDDIDNGLEFWPLKIDGHYGLISWIDAPELLEQLEVKYGKSWKKMIKPKLQNLVKTLDENSNPVVMIATVKK